MSISEISQGKDETHVGMTAGLEDLQNWHCVLDIDIFDGESTDYSDLIDQIHHEGNALMVGGASNQWQTLIGNGTTTAGQGLTYFNNANAAIGVGDSTTANGTPPVFTDLQAATNKLRKGMDATYPLHTDGTTGTGPQTITFRATFGTTEANWVWNEVGIFNSATAATGRMLNRIVQNLGTKASGTTWVVTISITLN